jgi:formate-dependent nitrite reductase membrane component NrfD
VNFTVVVSGTLLCLPVGFLLSAAIGHPVWPNVIGNPMLLLSSSLAATILVLRPFTRFEAKDRSVTFSVKLPPLAHLALALIAVSVVTAVLSYGLVENFAVR